MREDMDLERRKMRDIRGITTDFAIFSFCLGGGQYHIGSRYHRK